MLMGGCTSTRPPSWARLTQRPWRPESVSCQLTRYDWGRPNSRIRLSNPLTSEASRSWAPSLLARKTASDRPFVPRKRILGVTLCVVTGRPFPGKPKTCKPLLSTIRALGPCDARLTCCLISTVALRRDSVV